METCYVCEGSGWVVCDRCGGEGFLPGFATLLGFVSTCDVCFGSGEIECTECAGTGKL
jgi:DnaJ-class molecular chaperone